jgi:hypothetical protein
MNAAIKDKSLKVGFTAIPLTFSKRSRCLFIASNNHYFGNFLLIEAAGIPASELMKLPYDRAFPQNAPAQKLAMNNFVVVTSEC